MRSTEMNSRTHGRSMPRPYLIACTAGLAFCLAALLAGRPAAAQEFTIHIEPAAAFFVGEPQLSRFTPGFYLAIRPGVAMGSVVALQWSYALLVTAPKGDYTEDGSAHFLTAGMRLRPFATLRPASERLGGFFVDFNLGYVRTQDLDRFGFDTGAGYGFQIKPWFSLGVVVRYGQIVQPDDITNEDPNDAHFITLGLDFAFGPAAKKKTPPECPTAPECKQAEKGKEAGAGAVPCPDGDRDGVCDSDDRCLTQIGPPATLGCPIDPCSGTPLVILVQFEYDSAEMPLPLKTGEQTMDPVLDAVAAALAQNPSCRVCIIGHASEEGPTQHNDDLSKWRASAVQGYLINHGLTEAQIPTTGLGSSCPLVPESTLPLNRRVDFLRLQEGESCPTDCSYYKTSP